MPTSAVNATSTSLTENRASLEQRRISHAVIKSIPPPTQAPWMHAMTGFLQDAIEVKEDWSEWRISIISIEAREVSFPVFANRDCSCPPPLRSSPAVKIFPFAFRIITRTLLFAERDSNVVFISFQKSLFMAL